MRCERTGAEDLYLYISNRGLVGFATSGRKLVITADENLEKGLDQTSGRLAYSRN